MTRDTDDPVDVAAYRWLEAAEENVERWGNQRPKGLALALAEVLAEVIDELGIGEPETTGADAVLEDVRDAGYRARFYLETTAEDDDGNPLPLGERPRLAGVDDREAALDELEDLAPLVYQLMWALEAAERPDLVASFDEDGGRT